MARLGMALAHPFEYFEDRSFLARKQFTVMGVYRVAGEVTSRRFKQAKLRNFIQ